MSSAAIAIVIAIVGQTIAMVIGIAKVGGWVRSVNNALLLLDSHVVSDKLVHDGLKAEVSDLRVQLAEQRGYNLKRKTDFLAP